MEARGAQSTGQCSVMMGMVLQQVLGRRRADGRSLISVSEMRDGIITFESEADAQRYGALLEAEGHLEVSLPPLLIICSSWIFSDMSGPAVLCSSGHHE